MTAKKRPPPDLTPRPAGRRRATGARAPRGGPRNAPRPAGSLHRPDPTAPVTTDDGAAAKLRDRCAKKVEKLDAKRQDLRDKIAVLDRQRIDLFTELVEDLGAED